MKKIFSYAEKGLVAFVTLGVLSMVIRFLFALWSEHVTDLESGFMFGFFFVIIAFVMSVCASLLYDYLKNEK